MSDCDVKVVGLPGRIRVYAGDDSFETRLLFLSPAQPANGVSIPRNPFRGQTRLDRCSLDRHSSCFFGCTRHRVRGCDMGQKAKRRLRCSLWRRLESLRERAVTRETRMCARRRDKERRSSVCGPQASAV